MPLLRMPLAAIAFSLTLINEGAAQDTCSDSSLARAIAGMPEFIAADELPTVLEAVATLAGCDPENLSTSTRPPRDTQTANAGPRPSEVWVHAAGMAAPSIGLAVTGLTRELKDVVEPTSDQATQRVAMRPTRRVEITFSSKPAGAHVEYAGVMKGSTDMQALLSERALDAVRLVLDGYLPCDRSSARYEAGRFHCDMQARP